MSTVHWYIEAKLNKYSISATYQVEAYLDGFLGCWQHSDVKEQTAIIINDYKYGSVRDVITYIILSRINIIQGKLNPSIHIAQVICDR